ncbi:MAG TPA: hypothetical protein VMZ90_00250, partial [Vicinamibacterales bacterium]|nr:hypothetical protein [Vicinamibacterales bacterium]
MSRHFCSLAAVVLVLSLAPDVAAQTTTCKARVSTNLPFTVLFQEGEWRTTPPAQTRISDRDRVEVCIEHFNFLRYSLKFDVAEQRSESYAYLTKLWGSILSPSLTGVLGALGAAAPTTPGDELVLKLQMLYALSLSTDAAVASAARPYKATGLTDAQARTLAGVRGDENAQPKTGIAGQLDVLRRAYQDLQQFILTPANASAFAAVHGERQEMYRYVTDFYEQVNERSEIFLRLSGKTIGVEVKPVGKRQAGTRVTFTLIAV